LVTAIAAVPAATAQTAHVVGAGSSAQFLGTMIGMSQLAANNLGGQCQYHWTKKGALNAHDNRDNLGRILDENGNLGIVWLADCGDGTGNTNITSVWLDGQFDSTVGVRLFSAQQKAPTAGPGATVYLNGTTGGTLSDGLVFPNGLWADNKADIAIPAGLVTFIGNTTPGSLHVNMGLTDIRPEDALAATTRAKAVLNTTTYSGLGYQGPTGQIGAPIFTAQSGSTANLTPIGFALSGGNDPINAGVPVPAYTTFPVGAAPMVFAMNHTGSANPIVTNMVSGIKGDGTANVAGSYKLANLFDGTTSCDTNNAAFGGPNDGNGTALTLWAREPLSGTMNTTEYTVFRTIGNTSDSQEKGVINPTRAPYNPMNLNCPNKGGRQRRVGNGQVLSAINSTADSFGYFFFSFANAATVNGSAANASNFNYLTLDGVDPIGLSTTNQELPFCSATLCPASQWTGGLSFPSLRNGTYKAWSLYRWLVYNTNNDPLGPGGLVDSIQDNIDTTVADFVPFETTSGHDGLEVYRSHFTQSGKAGNNGNATPANTLDGGNTLGGGPEAGGDEGGAMIGWDYSVVNTANQTTGLCAGKTHVTKVSNLQINGLYSRNFGFSDINATHPAGQPLALIGLTADVNGTPSVVSNCINPTAASLYVNGSLGTHTHVSFSVYIAPNTPGAVNKKQ
jgi:ABC-type phosphate transport system substrate-binding protein